jgi:hypothetical protein
LQHQCDLYADSQRHADWHADHSDNASGSPHTVSLTGTGSSASLSVSSLTFSGIAIGASSVPQPVTLNNTGSVALAVSNITVTGDFSQTNNCGSSVGVGGSCIINVTFTPTASGTRTGILTITDNAGGVSGSTQTVSLTGTTSLSNTVSVTVGFGPNGYLGPPTATMSSYYDGIFTTVTVCQPGTTTCQKIDDVLVDTGSVGLRVLSTQLGSLSLSPVKDTGGDLLEECVQYGDGSFTWGGVQMATVQVGGETASQVVGGTANTGIPIQVISAPGTGIPVPAISCTSGGGGNDNTVASLGANGILGVGNYVQDCGSSCTSSSVFTGYPYWLCNSTGCGSAASVTGGVPLSLQVWNPVAAFSSGDTNGVALQLPTIPATGAADGTITGTLYFGIGTQSNNTITGGATVYGLDTNGNFATTVFHGVTYTSAGFLDSGSNGLYVSDAATLTSATGVSTVDCTDNYYYCPASTLNLSIMNSGSNGASGTVNISIANADSLFSANPTFAAFSNVGSDSGTDPTTDYFDFGLPFFFGRTVFVGIEGTNVGSTSYANGYWAF